jgi:hypothetical protein
LVLKLELRSSLEPHFFFALVIFLNYLFICYLFLVLWTKLRALYLLGKCSLTELSPQPLVIF